MLFDKRLALKERLKNSGDEETTQNELDEVEDNISKEVSKDNRDKVMEAFRDLTDTDGSIHINGLWSLKNKTFPKNTKPLPCAKRDVENRIISSQSELKTLYLETFRHRLRHRPIKDDLYYLFTLKEELCSKRLEFAKLNKSKKWDSEKLMKMLSSLKNNKSRDPHGFINELFKPGVEVNTDDV